MVRETLGTNTNTQKSAAGIPASRGSRQSPDDSSSSPLICVTARLARVNNALSRITATMRPREPRAVMFSWLETDSRHSDGYMTKKSALTHALQTVVNVWAALRSRFVTWNGSHDAIQALRGWGARVHVRPDSQHSEP
eukprot:7269880-Prymnesium_polylepis.2